MSEELIEILLSDLESRKGDYDLEGVELTPEDAERAASLISKGKSREEAIGTVLKEIRKCLEAGLDD